MQIGKFKHRVNVSAEFNRLAKEDEAAASALVDAGKYRQAIYFMVQAMEKYVREKIFSLVNPNLPFFINKNRSHSLEDAVEFLIEIVSKNNVHIESQVKIQFKNVLGDTKYNHLHNNIRYPVFFDKQDSYSMLEVTIEDCDILHKRLLLLKKFLNDLHRFT